MKKIDDHINTYANFVVIFIQGRYVATKGGPKQVFIIKNMPNSNNDPIFSTPGDIAINWKYQNNGHRLVLTGGHLSDIHSNDENTHGLGNHVCIGRTNITSRDACRIEVSNIQNCAFHECPSKNVIVQGTDHGSDYFDGPVYGSYAIYVSKGASIFPICNKLLETEMNEG